MRERFLWFALLLAVVASICASFAATTSPAPFGYDEADYMYAGTRGFAANFLDRNSQSFPAFVEKGLELAHDAGRRSSLSEYVRASGDISFYRHYHGPVYAYWISLWQSLGVRGEAGFRSTGLVLHAIGSLAIFWLFLGVFPELPPASAFVAGAVFAANRTAIVAATFITQHVVFAFFCCLALFAAAAFLRNQQPRYWYAAAALLAAAFASVEIAVVLIGAVVLAILFFEWNKGWRWLAGLLGRGALVFLATLLVIWPKGLLELNALKGYLYLAYMALYRKTFSPISPIELWGFKLRTYPLEFVLLGLALAVCLLGFRRLTNRRVTAPFLVYALAFLAVTLVITAPFTYYHASLTMALAVLTGIAFGEITKRIPRVGMAALLVVVLGSLAALDASYYRETVRARSASGNGTAEVLSYLRAHQSAQKIFVPYTMVPPLHFYQPELTLIGYDQDWTMERLAQESSSARAVVFCEEPLCRELERNWGAVPWKKEQVGLPQTGAALYAVRLSGSL